MKPVRFYEVCDHKGEVEWGGVSESEALTWFRKGLDRKIYVTKLVLTTLTEVRG
jgi:hypothetical protein